jgi:methyl-accepting chemotaxis protein
MDLDRAIEKHSDWKIRFCHSLHHGEILDVASIGRDDRCELGRWLRGEAEADYGGRASYVQCLAKHAAFHEEARRVAEIVQAGDHTGSEAMMDFCTPFALASSAVILSIVRLQKEAAN